MTTSKSKKQKKTEENMYHQEKGKVKLLKQSMREKFTPFFIVLLNTTKH